MLSVRNGAAAVEFYKAAYGAVVSRLSVGGAEFWLADESPEHQDFSPETLGGGTVRMVLTVPDPDASFARSPSGSPGRMASTIHSQSRNSAS
jgi:PhnB protein